MQRSEAWKTHPIHSGYEASTLGRIRNSKTGYVLNPSKTPKGYLQVDLGSRARGKMAHRVIAETFIGLSDMEVNHKNLVKTDNNLENLEFCTHQHNMSHAHARGSTKWANGEASGGNRYSAHQILAVKRHLACGIKPKEITALTGVSDSVIRKVSKNLIWKSLNPMAGEISSQTAQRPELSLSIGEST